MKPIIICKEFLLDVEINTPNTNYRSTIEDEIHNDFTAIILSTFKDHLLKRL